MQVHRYGCEDILLLLGFYNATTPTLFAVIVLAARPEA